MQLKNHLKHSFAHILREECDERCNFTHIGSIIQQKYPLDSVFFLP